MSLARGHLQEILVQSYPVIVCSDAGKLASTGGNEQCRSALLQHCRREIMSYSKMYFFFNLDSYFANDKKNRNVQGQHG